MQMPIKRHLTERVKTAFDRLYAIEEYDPNYENIRKDSVSL